MGMIREWEFIPRRLVSGLGIPVNLYVERTFFFAPIEGQDPMGRKAAMESAFSLHQIAHMQWMLLYGFPIDASRMSPAVRAQLEMARSAAAATAT